MGFDRAFALNRTDFDLAASTASNVSEAARRYAGALFDLASDKGELAAIAAELNTFESMARDSDDLARLAR